MSSLQRLLHSYLSKRDTAEIVRHETEQLWRVSQFTDFSLRKPSKCLILKHGFWRLTHIYNQMPDLLYGDWSTQPLVSPPALSASALHLQLQGESLNRSIWRCSSTTPLANEKIIVFFAFKTYVRDIHIVFLCMWKKCLTCLEHTSSSHDKHTMNCLIYHVIFVD